MTEQVKEQVKAPEKPGKVFTPAATNATKKPAPRKKPVRKKQWQLILYPESLPADWLERLDTKVVVKDIGAAISPLHDSDPWDDAKNHPDWGIPGMIKLAEDYAMQVEMDKNYAPQYYEDSKLKLMEEKHWFKKAHYHVIIVLPRGVTRDGMAKKLVRCLGKKAVPTKTIQPVEDLESAYDYLTHESYSSLGKHRYSKKDIIKLGQDIEEFIKYTPDQKYIASTKVTEFLSVLRYTQYCGEIVSVTGLMDTMRSTERIKYLLDRCVIDFDLRMKEIKKDILPRAKKAYEKVMASTALSDEEKQCFNEVQAYKDEVSNLDLYEKRKEIAEALIRDVKTGRFPSYRRVAACLTGRLPLINSYLSANREAADNAQIETETHAHSKLDLTPKHFTTDPIDQNNIFKSVKTPEKPDTPEVPDIDEASKPVEAAPDFSAVRDTVASLSADDIPECTDDTISTALDGLMTPLAEVAPKDVVTYVLAMLSLISSGLMNSSLNADGQKELLKVITASKVLFKAVGLGLSDVSSILGLDTFMIAEKCGVTPEQLESMYESEELTAA